MLLIILNTNNSLGYNYLASLGTTQGDLGLVADYDKDGFNTGISSYSSQYSIDINFLPHFI